MDLKDKLGFIPNIYIDDGHGVDTPGKRTPDGVRENLFNRPTAVKLDKLARELGFTTTLVAPELHDVPLETRVERVKRNFEKLKEKYPDQDPENLAVFISIHYNAQDEEWGGTQGGVETYYYPGSTRGEKLAALIQQELIKGTPQRNRGIKTANFYVLRKTPVPAVLVEAGFMDYKPEADLMTDDNFQEEVASEILAGVCKYYGLNIEKDHLEKVKEEKEYGRRLVAERKIEELEKQLVRYRDFFKQLKTFIELA